MEFQIYRNFKINKKSSQIFKIKKIYKFHKGFLKKFNNNLKMIINRYKNKIENIHILNNHNNWIRVDNLKIQLKMEYLHIQWNYESVQQLFYY
jgi:hypothetical protein